MNVEPYVGQYASAESAKKYIEYDKIVEACQMIKTTSDKLDFISYRVNSASEYCSVGQFSVQGFTYQDNVEECSNCFQYGAKELDEYADSILATLNKAINKKQEELNQTAIEEDKKITKQKEDEESKKKEDEEAAKKKKEEEEAAKKKEEEKKAGGSDKGSGSQDGNPRTKQELIDMVKKGQKPAPEVVQQLIKQGVITEQEAQQILGAPPQ